MARGGDQTAAAIAADGAFATDLYLHLSAGAGNIAFSPAGIAAALGMALLGAHGETAAELAAVLHLASPKDAADGVASLAGVRAGQDVTLRAPSTLWLQSGIPVRQEFCAALPGTAALMTADFARDAAGVAREINDAVSAQTAGKITGLIPPGVLSGLTRLVLVSAVYLKAPWANPFPAAGTRDAPFHPERSAPSHVPMMHLEAALNYRRGDGYAAVLLPYRGGALAMAVVLPDGPLTSLDAPLHQVGLRGILNDLRGGPRPRVRLGLPRFRVTAGCRLDDTLRALGAVHAFGPGADFSGITEAERLFISAVVHKAYVDVDERGTEAAAATAVAMKTLAVVRRPDPVVTMTVDRPFLFAIMDTATGLPLFAGQVARP